MAKILVIGGSGVIGFQTIKKLKDLNDLILLSLMIIYFGVMIKWNT